MSLAGLGATARDPGRAIALGYLVIAVTLNLVWETAQLPLYTIWQTSSAGELAFIILHCTGGDLLILAVILVLALLLIGDADWPRFGYRRVILVTTILGLGYTVFSEWLNVEVRGSWAYAAAMPLIPPLGTGLAPLLQWLIIPPASLALAKRFAAVLHRAPRWSRASAGSSKKRGNRAR
jgi:hypothetical protein